MKNENTKEPASNPKRSLKSIRPNKRPTLRLDDPIRPRTILEHIRHTDLVNRISRHTNPSLQEQEEMKDEHKPVNNKKNQKSPVLDKKKQPPRNPPHPATSDTVNPVPSRLNVERLVKWTSLLVNVCQSIAWLFEYVNSSNLQLWINGNQWFLVLPVTGILLPVASLFLPSGVAQTGSQAKGKAGKLGSQPIIVD